MNNSELTIQEFIQFSQFLERQCGIVLPESKGYLVKSRLMPLVRSEKLESLSVCLQLILSNDNNRLREKVIDAMTTNETLWFRDKYPFDILANSLFDTLAKQKRKVRIWCAACSSGQEPYSIAMLIHEFKQKSPNAFPSGVEILATDISSVMLKHATSGLYDNITFARGLDTERKNKFFKKVNDNAMQLSPVITSMVSFKMKNLLDDYASFGKFDVIFCRNVLIYFSPINKRNILQQIAACLQDDGTLFLGASESIADSNHLFSLVRNNPGLYYTKK